MQATDGSFYGTTYIGGNYGNGTVFKVTSNGTLTTVYSFCSLSNCADGDEPRTGVVQASDGNFYGTTIGGANGEGTVFKLTPSGTLTTLYTFCSKHNCADGDYPTAALSQASDGNFYGSTQFGGANGEGTIFKITPSGTLTTLYNFCSQENCSDGFAPSSALMQASDGNLYGTTGWGGANCENCGTIFEITLSGALTTLYTFCGQQGCDDGFGPEAGLVQATDGNFYGTASQGGGQWHGTVFRFATGMSGTKLLFPLKGIRRDEDDHSNAYTAPLNTSFDHSMARNDGHFSIYGCDYKVTDFIDEVGDNQKLRASLGVVDTAMPRRTITSSLR